MVLRLGDLPAGAKVVEQRYFTDREFGNAVSYSREFEGGRLGGTELLGLESIAEVGRSVGDSRSALRTVRAVFGTKRGRALLKQEIAAVVAEEDGLISDFRLGRPRNLGTGDEGFDVAGSLRLIGLRMDFHFTFLRVDRIVGLLFSAGEPGRRLSFASIRRLGSRQVAHTRQELAPRILAPPTVSGAPVEGQTLTATAGTWKGNPQGFTYQWRRCDTAGANCSDITGAASSTYLLTAAERGFTVRIAVTARSPYGSATAFSAPTTVVGAATGVPVNTALPAVVGTPQQGQTLSATTGSWGGAPTAFGYQWQRCDSSGASCADVPGATGATYAVTAADVGFRIRVVVTATSAAGSGSSSSLVTEVVT